ncbi:MAG TPA: hypothetical protein VIJ87_06755 [Pyrinomonadaceae bacterium]
MPKNDDKSFKIEDAELIFRNFSGKAGKYNVDGERNFAVLLPEDVAQQMLADDWNVKWLEPREEGDERRAYISINVKFGYRPPRIVLITGTARQNVTEETVGVLDWANIETADLICRGFFWEVGGKSGWKPYLQSLFVTIEEDDLERKYAINVTE